MELDLTNLTLTQVIGLTVLVTAVDVVAGILLAIMRGQFNIAYVAVWLRSHVIPRVSPIVLLAILGQGIPAFDIPAIGPAFGLAIAGLATYAIETVASVRDSFRDTTPNTPTDLSPVPPPA